jgi:hypothetical protein
MRIFPNLLQYQTIACRCSFMGILPAGGDTLVLKVRISNPAMATDGFGTSERLDAVHKIAQSWIVKPRDSLCMRHEIITAEVSTEL